MAGIRSEALLGRWVHSQEEDGPAGMVYRTASYPFPPARGRNGFELGAGGALRESRPGPVDRTVEAAGTWSIEGDDLLVLSATGPGFPGRKLRVVSVDGERLVVQRAES